MAGMGRLIITDTILSFMWVWAGIMVRIIVQNFKALSNNDQATELFRCCIIVVNMFLFTYLVKLTNGGAYNPVVVFTSAINAGDFATILFNIARIPFQVNFIFLHILYRHARSTHAIS